MTLGRGLVGLGCPADTLVAPVDRRRQEQSRGVGCQP